MKKVTQLDFTWEKREKLIRKEEYEQGFEQGGLLEREKAISAMIEKKYTKEQILDLGYTEQEYENAKKA